ncbi:hypothetical protein CUT44_14135 [Streptomyces carminius]|uniref:Uncharacterized protein n=1 Tax=Streptomyces carminius TaxID=2665496 RepID=A0A2M8LYS3_9ACTN|nr:hypothetical protein [Streptomyces carminius]PJE97117.1 hypothetical protein CUT44_14135 [Streptomyces carminius]
MSTGTSSLADVAAALDGGDRLAVLAASWDAFDAGQQVADAVAWQPGYDELQVLAAAEAATAGRALLPLPAGRPVALLDHEAALPECVGVLEKAGRCLAALAEGGGEDAEALRAAAARAVGAARCLRTARAA